jgi:alpha-galactosidase
MTRTGHQLRVVALQGASTCVLLEWPQSGAPIWRYWGPGQATALASEFPFGWREGFATPPASLDELNPLTIAPTFGAGWYSESALLAHRGGRDFAQQWTHCTVEQIDLASVHIDLHDVAAQLRLRIELGFDSGSDVLSMQSTLTNLASEITAAPLDVSWLAAGTLMLPAQAMSVRSWGGVWANEFAPNETLLSKDGWRQESRRGRAGHDAFPGAVVSCGVGLDYALTLAWSGNHAQQISLLDDGRYQWQAGEWLAPGEVQPAPGESIESPVLLATCSTHGIDGLAQQLHAAVRRRLTWPGGRMRPRPIHINTWEAVYFDHNEAALKALASDAASLGVERFVLDDGWFKGRCNDQAGLGDWTADPIKFPRGLAPLAKHVRDCGMQFGLWVEPEMVNPDSDLYRAHPDWALQLSGRPLPTARNQLVLDLTNPAVTDYLFAALQALLAQLPIDYLKWDMNRDLTMAGNGAGQAAYRRQVLALHALLARVRQQFPAVEIESCSSGGARMDYAMLRYAHRVWPSDCNDAIDRLRIQQAALQWLPPELLGAHIGAAPAHTTGRSQSLDFRAAVALPCHFGLELDPRKLTAPERATLQRWMALYRSIRDQLHQGRVWRGDSGDGVHWQAHEQAHEPAHRQALTEDGATNAIVFVYRIQPSAQRLPPSLRLLFVRDEAQYVMQRIEPRATGVDATAQPPFSAQGCSLALSGAWLRNIGLPLPRMNAQTALVLELKKV